MSSWSEIRARSTDPLSSTINSLILRQNQSQAITDEITDADTIFPVRILSSKVSIQDGTLTTGYSKPISQAFFMPFEPDGDVVKLWTRFDSGGVTVTDYSCFSNNIEIKHDQGSAPQPPLLMTAEDEGISKNKISSYLQKDKKHYFRITDPQFSLSDNKHVCFFFKIYPTLINNEYTYSKRAVLLDYIENDQVTHGVRVELDDAGHVHFYIQWDSLDYYIQSDVSLFTFPDEPDYFSQDYSEEDYYASTEDKPFTLPLDFVYIFCTFNKDTKVATVLNPISDTVCNTWASDGSEYSGTSVFPPPFDDPPEPDPPGTPYTLPFTQTPYDQQTGTAFSAIKPVTVSGLISVYNVSGGTPVTDPVVLQYNVPEGTGGGSSIPFSAIYTQNGTSSDEVLSDQSGDSIRHAAKVENSSSSLNGKVITKIEVWAIKSGSVSGNVSAGIRKGSDDSFISFGTVAASSLPTSYTTKTVFTLTTNTYTLVPGDYVSVEYNGPGEVRVARSTTLNDSNSKRYYYTDSWHSTGTNYNLSLVIYTGGTSTTITPWITINSSSQQIIGEIFSSGSAMNNKAPTKVELKVKKKSGTTGTLYLQIITNASPPALKTTLKTWNVGTDPAITTSDPAAGVLNLVWEDVTNTVTIGTNERLVLTAGTTLNIGGEVYVMSNLGNNTPTTDTSKNHNSTNSYIMKRSSSSTWSTYDNQLDITGKISTGGNDFTGYINLDGSRKRTGIKADTATSSLVGKKITKVTATLKKVGTPTAGAIYCRIRNSAGSERVTINQTDISAISTSDTSVDFVNTTHNITLALDDTISIEYELGDTSNYVSVRVNTNQFESTDTILFESLSTAINITNPVSNRDLAGILYTGGETDSTARPRVGISCNNSDSSLWGRAITKIRLWLKREGSTFDPGDEISVKIIRGSDKATVATLGTEVILDIPTTETQYDFENTGNSYVMANGDMIVVENLEGNSTNYVWVKRSDTDVIDGSGSCLVDWNSVAYNLDISKDINAVCWTGGYTVYPDPSIPTAPTPYHYSHEMFFGSKTTEDSNAEISPEELEPDSETMFSFIAADFRVYQGKIIDENDALNLFKNKYSISPVGFGEVNTVAHSVVASG